MPVFYTALRLASDTPGQPGRRWSNVFYYDVANPGIAAAALVGGWIEYLRNASRERVYAYEAYATDLVEGTANYAVVPVPAAQSRGTIPTSGLGEPYRPQVCLAVTLNATASRPSRKFWRPGLYEGDILNGVTIVGALVETVRTNYSNFLDDAAGNLCDPQGDKLQSVGRITLTSRNFGREATVDVPIPPPLG